MHDDDRDALLAMVLMGGATAPRRRLLAAHPSPHAARMAGPVAWRLAGLDATQLRAFDGGSREHAPSPRMRAWFDNPRHHLVGWQDPDYPALLRTMGSPPVALFVDGDPAVLWHPAVAIVGSRAATAGGRDNARHFAQMLALSGLSIVSGMARGIDAAAHAGAMAAQGITVAVLGTGVDMPYPNGHAVLHGQIAACGAVVSEHPPGTLAKAAQFPARNRILAGLAMATVVVEAAERSGALITARLAGEAGRDVFSLPGSIQNPMARGCHRLIRDGAGLVETPDEIVSALRPIAISLGDALRARLGAPTSAPVAGQSVTPSHGLGADPDYNRLWDALGHDPTGMDQLADRSGLTTDRLSSMLLLMELEGQVGVAHGRYCRKS